jgi:hypothetical protein
MVHGIAAVDIASADPAAIAAQWGRMLDAEPRAPLDGWRIDLLHDASIRFVPVAAGVPPGIAGVTLFTCDAGRALRRAYEAKVPVVGDSVMICDVPVRVIARF